MGEAARRKRHGPVAVPAPKPEVQAFPPKGQHLRLSHVVVVASLDVVRDIDGKRVGGIVTPQGGQKPEDQPWVMQEADIPDAVIDWLRERLSKQGVKL